MKPATVVATFAAAVLAAVIGWFGGGLVHDALAPAYETALGVVDARAGIPVATASPTPSASAAPTATATTSPPAEDTPGSILCEGAPPDESCDCDLQDGEWVWVCELEASIEPAPSAPPAPTP